MLLMGEVDTGPFTIKQTRLPLDSLRPADV